MRIDLSKAKIAPASSPSGNVPASAEYPTTILNRHKHLRRTLKWVAHAGHAGPTLVLAHVVSLSSRVQEHYVCFDELESLLVSALQTRSKNEDERAWQWELHRG